MTEPALVVIDSVLPSDRPVADRVRPWDPRQPYLSVLDLAATRGDGIFETFGVVDGAVQAEQLHLDRLANSARMLDLPELDLEVVRYAVHESVRRMGAVAVGLVKVVVTRGIEDADPLTPTAWSYAFPSPDFSAAHRDGIRVVCLDRGYRSDVATTSPWLLQGAKTLSYAVNCAALREAARRGADDVIFVSTDQYVLEGPTATVVALIDGVFCTPSVDQGILAGTTQADLFTTLERMGRSTAYRKIRRAELDDADGLWLVSSGRHLARAVTLDGRPVRHDPELSDTMLRALLGRTQ